MKQPLTLLVVCLVVVLAATGYGWYERAKGAQAERQRITADSLLHASQNAQDSILQVDSLRGVADRSRLDSLSRVLEASRAHYARSRGTVDSLISATRSDSEVPRDSVAALVGAFQQERAAADSQIATLTTENALLRATVAGKDSTIRALTQSLATARAGWAQALKPAAPGLLDRALRLGELVLAARGAVAFAVGR